jgi:flagellar protein FlaG
MNSPSSIGTVNTVPQIPGRVVASTPATDPGVRVSYPVEHTEPTSLRTQSQAQDELVRQATQKQSEESAEKLQKALSDLTNTGAASNTGLRFRVEQKSGRVVVEIVDSKTGDLLKQIPSEEALRIAQQLADGGSSGLVDDRV